MLLILKSCTTISIFSTSIFDKSIISSIKTSKLLLLFLIIFKYSSFSLSEILSWLSKSAKPIIAFMGVLIS